MKRSKSLSWKVGAVLIIGGFVVTTNVAAAHAQGFFSFFRPFGGYRAPAVTPYSAMGYGAEPNMQFPPRSASRSAGTSSSAYCVRTCDGRYFPVPAAASQSRADTCKSFCPAAETRVFYGSKIENASSENGKDYDDLPNAYKFRSELVPGCSCNGTDPVGLAQVDIHDDKTLRQGDFVASADGLKVVSGRSDRRGAEVRFSPAPRSVQALYERKAALN